MSEASLDLCRSAPATWRATWGCSTQRAPASQQPAKPCALKASRCGHMGLFYLPAICTLLL